MSHTIADYMMQGTRIELVVITLLVPGHLQGIALAVFNKHLGKLMR